MKSFSISGFGGSYEWGCQCMLQLGLEWLKAHPDFKFDAYKAYKGIYGIYGICTPETELAKQLDKALMDDATLKEFGVTGAMHQAVIGHLAYIHGFGYEKWCEETTQARTEDPGDIYEDYDVEANRPKAANA